MAKGYRIGWPEETDAAKVLDFEYTDLDNKETHVDVARFLGLVKVTLSVEEPMFDWPTTLAKFRQQWRDAKGVWLCPTLRDSITYYGEWYGEGMVIERWEYDPERIIVNLGADGIFVLNPEYLGDVGPDLLAPFKKLLAEAYRTYRERYGV